MRDRPAIKQIVFELINPKTILGKNQLDKSFDEMIKNNQLKNKKMKNDNNIDGLQIYKAIEQPVSEFQKELSILINKYSRENMSDTPDFILAQYLEGCLTNYSIAVTKRDQWFFGKTVWDYKTEKQNK